MLRHLLRLEGQAAAATILAAAAGGSSSVLVPSATLGRIAGATGGPNQGHLVFSVNQQRWWFFTAIGAIVDSGTATGAGQSTTALTDTSKAWTTNQYTDYTVWLTGGTGARQLGAIC